MNLCKRTKHLHANRVCNALQCEQGVGAKNRTNYFDLFSCASNFISLQVTFLTFAEFANFVEFRGSQILARKCKTKFFSFCDSVRIFKF